MYLDAIRRREEAGPGETFPWNIPALQTLQEIKFNNAVTFLVGENGSGKSTLLEGMAAGMRAYAVGSSQSLDADKTLDHSKLFADAFYFSRKRHAKVKMFLRAEDVFGHVRELLREMRELDDEADHLESADPRNSVPAAMLRGTARSIRKGDPDGRSHGETFLKIMGERLHGGGLYFLDEPDAPLSPGRQIALIDIIRASVRDGGQFIIATHSPIMLATPGATIYVLDRHGIYEQAYDELPSVILMREFLKDPGAILEGRL